MKNESSHKKNYTAADFARYHSGQMTEPDMHELEKEALNDPFLADALDGYRQTSTAENDIRFLKEQIAIKASEEKKKPVMMYRKNNRVWLSAAAILIVSVTGYFIFQQEEKKDIVLAKNDQATSIQQQEPTNSDTEKNTAASPAAPDQATVSVNEVGKIKSTIKDQLAVKQKTIPTEPMRDEIVSYQNDVSAKSADGFAAEMESSKWAKKYAKTPADSLSAAVAANVTPGIQVSGKISTDSASRYRFSISDSLGLASTKPEKFDPSTAYNVTPKADVQLELNDKGNQLDEVVVTAVGKRKDGYKSKESVTSAATVVTKEQVMSSIPAKGWDDFHQYIKSNRKYSLDDSGDTIRGMVRLVFKISKTGTPIKIKVDKSLCHDCDVEAIRLLSAGPKWTYPGNTWQKTDIFFE
jgi:hypothetical protein